jgi:hypothetical protein
VSALRPPLLVDVLHARRREAQGSGGAGVMTSITFVRRYRLDDEPDDESEEDDEFEDEEGTSDDDEEEEPEDDVETWQVSP